VCQIVSAVRISTSFQFVGQLGSEVRISVSFQSFALRMFVCSVFAVLSAVPCVRKVIFVSHLSCHVSGNWVTMPPEIFVGAVHSAEWMCTCVHIGALEHCHRVGCWHSAILLAWASIILTSSPEQADSKYRWHRGEEFYSGSNIACWQASLKPQMLLGKAYAPPIPFTHYCRICICQYDSEWLFARSLPVTGLQLRCEVRLLDMLWA